MILFFSIFLLLNIFSIKPVNAQNYNIPIFYQLIEAYKPYQSPQYGQPTHTTVQQVVENQTISVPVVIKKIENTPTVTIAILGDSMIDTLGSDIPKLVKSLSNYYPTKNIKILNYGYGSSTLESSYTRIAENYNYRDKYFPSLISQSPDIIIIESFAYNNFGNTQTGFDKKNGLLTQTINTIHEKLPKTKIMFAATISPNSVIFANNQSGSQFTSLEKIEKTNTIKKYLENHIKYASEKYIPIANTYSSTVSNNDGMKQFIDTNDGIHPSTYGNEFFCDTLAKALFDNHFLD